MLIHPFLGRLPKPFEAKLIVGLVSTASISIGVVALIVAVKAGSDRRELADELATRGGWAIAFGLGLWGVAWLVGRWRDYDS